MIKIVALTLVAGPRTFVGRKLSDLFVWETIGGWAAATSTAASGSIDVANSLGRAGGLADLWLVKLVNRFIRQRNTG